MGTWYVSSLATGAGTGSQASPWTLDQAAAASGGSDTVYIKADGVYGRSASWVPAVADVAYIAYGTTPGDGVQATIKATSGSGYWLVNPSATRVLLANLIIDGNGIANSIQFATSSCAAYRCTIKGGQYLLWGGGSNYYLMAYCDVYATPTQAGNLSHIWYRCFIGAGGTVSAGVCVQCIGTGATSGNTAPFAQCMLLGCDSRSNYDGLETGDGSNKGPTHILDTTISNSTNKGIETFFGTSAAAIIDRLHLFGNPAGTVGLGSSSVFGATVNDAADPLPNAGSGNYAPSAGISGQSFVWPGLSGTTSAPAIGAVQSAGSGGGSGGVAPWEGAL